MWSLRTGLHTLILYILHVTPHRGSARPLLTTQLPPPPPALTLKKTALLPRRSQSSQSPKLLPAAQRQNQVDLLMGHCQMACRQVQEERAPVTLKWAQNVVQSSSQSCHRVPTQLVSLALVHWFLPLLRRPVRQPARTRLWLRTPKLGKPTSPCSTLEQKRDRRSTLLTG